MVNPSSGKRGVSPAVVAFIRGAAEAAILAALGVIIVALGDTTTAGDLAPWAPIGLLVLRQLEGLVDANIDPTRQRVTGGTTPVPHPHL